MKDQLYKIASILEKRMPPRMLVSLLNKCSFIKYDETNPLYYMHHDEHYVGGTKRKNYKKIEEMKMRASIEKEK